MAEEFSKEELLNRAKSITTNNKIEIDDLANLVFDASFPSHLFENAKEHLSKYIADHNRRSEISDVVLAKSTEASELLAEMQRLEKERLSIPARIQELNKRVELLEAEIKPLVAEYQDVQARIQAQQTGK